MRTFVFFGDKQCDYRSLMANQKDFYAKDRLIPLSHTVIAEQVASDKVYLCSIKDNGAGTRSHPQIQGVDALITTLPNQYILIRTADCFPVLFEDKKQRVVAAVHSGREGTRLNLIGKTLNFLKEKLGIMSQDLIAYIGAGICGEHYTVDEGTWRFYNECMEQQGFFIEKVPFCHIDLRAGITQQLLAAGVPSNQIVHINTCTFESPLYFSYRRDKTDNRQISLIGLIDE